MSVLPTERNRMPRNDSRGTAFWPLSISRRRVKSVSNVICESAMIGPRHPDVSI